MQPHEVLERGAKGQVVALKESKGRCPAREFLARLDKQAKGQFRAAFQRLVTTGTLKSPERYRRLEVPGKPPVFEIKAPAGPGWRLYVIREGDIWIATHGAKKPSDRKVAREADRARTMHRECWNGHV
ncbi:UNVERIFIED_CONTAM: hypothetical protein LK11_00825 [Mumia flava]